MCNRALLHEKGARPHDVFSAPVATERKDRSGLTLLANGQVLAALREETPHSGVLAEALRKDLERLFGKDCSGIKLLEADKRAETCLRIRKDLSHFNLLHDDSFALDLTTLVNRTRGLMSYDRKLKNAVSKSIKELLAREGLTLSWDMTDRHDLENARIGATPAVHLGGRKLAFRGGNRRPEPVRENLHSPTHLEAVARLFGGKVVEEDDVTNLDLSSIDWAAEPHNIKETHRHRPAGPRKSPPKRRAYHAPR